MPEAAWRGLLRTPAPQLIARVRDELEGVAREAPPQPARGGSIRSRQLEGGYVALIAVDFEKCRVTLVEVTELSGAQG